MIMLDTNYLIRSLVKDAPEAEHVLSWLAAGEQLCASSVSWYEFVCGPVDEGGIDTVFSVLSDRVLPFTADQAVEASRLFNATGRKRFLRVNAMIAAAAIFSNARLATDNGADFELFEPFGLSLVSLEERT